MLDFFRRHQRYFFYVITVVIVISFSFFGTYSTLSDGSFREQIAFTAVDGTDVTRHELDEMATFLGTDATDKMLFGGIWGPNFLNNGVIKNDFLETGLGTMLVMSYPQELEQDLIARHDKEKRFSLYSHPQARFIGTEAAWGTFAPEMSTYYHMLRQSTDPLAPEALQSRVALFLMERQFPAPILRQLLRYQEKQYNWVKPDPRLDQVDLSLFGYHTTEDWFGPRFVRLVSQFIMNAAIIAEEKGYEVTKEEALADLMHNAEISYQQNAQSPHIGVSNSTEYFNEQLRRLGMDHNIAANVWRQVLLFRRLFQDMGSSVFVDPQTFQNIDAYALAGVEGELYTLPKEMRLGNYRALQKFEVYLDAIAKRSEDDKAKLRLPTNFLSTSEISQKYPELVQKRYVLEVVQADKKSLENKISVKDSWNWEVEDKNWEELKKQFPELAKKNAKTREERFAALEAMDGITRNKIDAHARAAIVNAHSDWLDQALANASSRKIDVGLHEKGINAEFIGIENGKAFMQLLDAAPLANAEAKTNAEKDAKKQLSAFSGDKNTYYRINVIARSGQPEVLTFAQADQQGALDKILDRTLEAYYIQVREANTKDFQRDDMSWRAFADVKEKVANLYFDKVLKNIQTAYANAIAPEAAPQNMIGDYAASLRLYPYVKEIKEKLQKNPGLITELTRESNKASSDEKKALADQWKLERRPYQTTRSSSDNTLDKSELFSLQNGAWSKVNGVANGDISFFHVEKAYQAAPTAMRSSTSKARELLADAAQQRLMGQVLKVVIDKKAISFDYLNQKAATTEID